MRQYNSHKPLIFIHIPKAAGTSTQVIFRSWFKHGFYKHYYNEKKGTLPKKHTFHLRQLLRRQTLIYGHFNSTRKFGIEDYYPDVKQFITILRSPLELAISSYFYVRANSKKWKDQSGVPKESLPDYICATKVNMLNNFPRKVTLSNYKEIIEKYFIYIGIVEQLEDSLRMIAYSLGKTFNASLLPHTNVTERDQAIGDNAKALFMEQHKLEYLVYEYAKERHRALIKSTSPKDH